MRGRVWSTFGSFPALAAVVLVKVLQGRAFSWLLSSQYLGFGTWGDPEFPTNEGLNFPQLSLPLVQI